MFLCLALATLCVALVPPIDMCERCVHQFVQNGGCKKWEDTVAEGRDFQPAEYNLFDHSCHQYFLAIRDNDDHDCGHRALDACDLPPWFDDHHHDDDHPEHDACEGKGEGELCNMCAPDTECVEAMMAKTCQFDSTDNLVCLPVPAEHDACEGKSEGEWCNMCSTVECVEAMMAKTCQFDSTDNLVCLPVPPDTTLFSPATKSDLTDAIEQCLNEDPEGDCVDMHGTHGPMSSWDVSAISDFGEVFAGRWQFNQDIGSWDMSQAINMGSMFFNASAFNQYINNWETSKVTHMNNMFSSATAFNQDIGNWNTASVITMHGMFLRAFAFNRDIGNWNTATVVEMGHMFQWATAFSQESIGSWDTSNVAYMTQMFDGSGLASNPPSWYVPHA